MALKKQYNIKPKKKKFPCSMTDVHFILIEIIWIWENRFEKNTSLN